jgi:hypothetical protein
MDQRLNDIRKNPRLLLSGVMPVVIIIGLLIATGNPFSSGNSEPATPSGTGQGGAVSPASPTVQGEVVAKVEHLHGNLWQFLYTVRNTGKTPIAGLQINGPRANLFDVTARRGWGVFGAGICGGKYPDVLTYWSTGGSGAVIHPNQSAVFGFKVRTSGSLPRLYALSGGQASPQFGRFLGPAASNLPADGACKR